MTHDRQISAYSSPLVERYIAFRDNLLRQALTVQTMLAVIAAAAIVSLSTFAAPLLHGFVTVTAILVIPSIYPGVSLWLRHFQRSGWRRRWPEYDFCGLWSYKAQYQIDSIQSGHAQEKLLREMFESVERHGCAQIRQDVFECRVQPGHEEIETKSFGTITDYWRSDAIMLHADEIRWSFQCSLDWPAGVDLEPKYVGYEEYRVERDPVSDLPIKLIGQAYFRARRYEGFVLSSKCVFERNLTGIDPHTSILRTMSGFFQKLLSRVFRERISTRK